MHVGCDLCVDAMGWDWPTVLRYPRSVGACREDRHFNICVKDFAMAAQFTGLAYSRVGASPAGGSGSAMTCSLGS
jgi:hypothetical protein